MVQSEEWENHSQGSQKLNWIYKVESHGHRGVPPIQFYVLVQVKAWNNVSKAMDKLITTCLPCLNETES